MGLTPSEIGARAERAVAYALEGEGWTVYLPHLAPHARVDMIATRGPELLRVQAKTSVIRNGVITFRPFSNTGNVARGYRGEVDAFGVFSPELDRVYLIPVDVPATRCCHLRLAPAANNQQKGVRLAADYEIGAARLALAYGR